MKHSLKHTVKLKKQLKLYRIVSHYAITCDWKKMEVGRNKYYVYMLICIYRIYHISER